MTDAKPVNMDRSGDHGPEFDLSMYAEAVQIGTAAALPVVAAKVLDWATPKDDDDDRRR